jgi:hypothetical protein
MGRTLLLLQLNGCNGFIAFEQKSDFFGRSYFAREVGLLAINIVELQ